MAELITDGSGQLIDDDRDERRFCSLDTCVAQLCGQVKLLHLDFLDLVCGRQPISGGARGGERTPLSLSHGWRGWDFSIKGS